MKGHCRRNSRFEDDNGHNWSEFNSCFEQLFNMNDVSEENKREIFLALCGDVYDRLGNNGWTRRDETLESHHGHHLNHHLLRRGHHGHHGHHGHRHGHQPGHAHMPGHAHERGHIHGQQGHGPHGHGHGPHGHGHGIHNFHGFRELHGRFRSLSTDRH